MDRLAIAVRSCQSLSAVPFRRLALPAGAQWELEIGNLALEQSAGVGDVRHPDLVRGVEDPVAG
jgi:hypothetical protein